MRSLGNAVPLVWRYFWNILIAIDQLANTLLAGDPDETISSRAGKLVNRRDCTFCYWLCRALHILDKDHCEKSIEPDEGKNGIWK